MAMSLRTPDAIRTLWRKLHGKVWRADVLPHAYELARANDGAPGVDGMTFGHILAPGLENWLYRLGEAVRANLYMNRFLTDWRQTGRREAWKAHVINHADGFVSPGDGVRDISPLRGLILSRGHATEALAWTDCTMARPGLTLNLPRSQPESRMWEIRGGATAIPRPSSTPLVEYFFCINDLPPICRGARA